MLTAAIAVLLCTVLVWFTCFRRRQGKPSQIDNPTEDTDSELKNMGNAQPGSEQLEEHWEYPSESREKSSDQPPGSKDNKVSPLTKKILEHPELMEIDRAASPNPNVHVFGRQRSLDYGKSGGLDTSTPVVNKRSKSISDQELMRVNQAQIVDANKNLSLKEIQKNKTGGATASDSAETKSKDQVELRKDSKRKLGKKNKREAVIVNDDEDSPLTDATKQDSSKNGEKTEPFKRRGLFPFHSFRSKSDNPTAVSVLEEQIGLLKKQVESEQKERKKAENWAKTLAAELEKQVQKRSEADASAKELKAALADLQSAHVALQKEVADLVYDKSSDHHTSGVKIDPDFLLLKKEHAKLQASYRSLQRELGELVYGDAVEVKDFMNDLDRPILSPGQQQESLEEDNSDVNPSDNKITSTLNNNYHLAELKTSSADRSRTSGNGSTAAFSLSVSKQSPATSASPADHTLPSPPNHHGDESSHSRPIPSSTQPRDIVLQGSPCLRGSRTPSSISTSLESLVNANTDYKGFSFDDVFSANLDAISDDEDLFDLVPSLYTKKTALPSKEVVDTQDYKQAPGGDQGAMSVLYTRENGRGSDANGSAMSSVVSQPLEPTVPPGKLSDNILTRLTHNKEAYASARSSYEKTASAVSSDKNNSAQISVKSSAAQKDKLLKKVSQWEDITKSFKKQSQITSKRQSVEDLNANVQERKKKLEDIFEQSAEEHVHKTKPDRVRLCSKTELEIEASIMSSDVDFNSIKAVNVIKSKFEQK